MGLFVASLNSGSNGNCYYVSNGEEAVLVDAGISRRETERRMKRLELSMKRVKAIFISHEHSDHIYGVNSLSRQYKIPVYVTDQTLRSGRLAVREDLLRPFRAGEPIQIGNLNVLAFEKFHDAVDPHSFIISGNNITVGVFTDIGRTCDRLISHFAQCHAAFLESNYDEYMLDTGRYPLMLKNRIRGGYGHISNIQALELFTKHRPPFMSHLFLAHLSQQNNSPELVHELFSGASGKTQIIVASRYKESDVYEIDDQFFDPAPLREIKVPQPAQLSLF